VNSLNKNRKDAFRQIRQVGILTTIPFILLLGPLIGFFIGQWVDQKFGISPVAMIFFIVLGFAGSARETARMIRDVMRDQ